METFGEEVWVSLASITDTISNWRSKFKSPSKADEDVSLEDLDKLSQQCDEIGTHIVKLSLGRITFECLDLLSIVCDEA